MTKIKNTVAYPIKQYPVVTDFFIGSDSENNGETVNFEIQSIINMASGLMDYIYSKSSLPLTAPQGNGYFTTNGITDFSLITNMSVSKLTLAGQDLTLYLNFLKLNTVEFTLKIISKTNQNVFAYYSINTITEYPDYFDFAVVLAPGDNYLGELADKDIYTFTYEKIPGAGPSFITQVITDGDTTHAPSGNAVFDALALKEDIINKIDTISGSSTIKYPSEKAVVDYVATQIGSNFYITGTNIDAGSIKTGSITKEGEMVIDSLTPGLSGFRLLQLPNKVLTTDANGFVIGATFLQDVQYALPSDITALLTQTITNGDITHAPSGDAVFDALAIIQAQLIPVSATQSGIVNNISLQELGGVDKLINGLRIGQGAAINLNNVIVGDIDTLHLNTTGNYLTGVGNGSLNANTTGANNTALGAFSLWSNSTGGSNTALGSFSLQLNTTGVNNTAIGDFASNANISGSNNVAIGFTASQKSTAASFNVAVGNAAMRENLSSASNTAVGYAVLRSMTAGTGNNTGLGTSALRNLLTGNANTAIGSNSMLDATGGAFNTGVGNTSLQHITTASNNTGVGSGAGSAFTIGSSNTAIGYLAMGFSTGATGNYNIAIGYQAGRDITSGSGNILIETPAGSGSIITGSNNLVINPGSRTTGVTTGSGNTLIGGVIGLATSLANTVIIADGNATQAIRKNTDNTLLAPTQTNPLIIADATGKAIVTKEYLASISSTLELVSNKQNSLSIDGTGTKYPTVDIINKAVTYVTPEEYGAVGNGIADDKIAIQNAINSNKMVLLNGNYFISGTITISNKTTIYGNGKLITTANLPTIDIKSSDIIIDGIRFEGNGRGTATNYVTTRPLQIGINLEGIVDTTVYKNIRLSNLYFYNLGGAGIKIASNKDTNYSGGMLISNTFADSCFIGYYLAERAEYNSFSNFRANLCEYAAYIIGGNNSFSNPNFEVNRTGIYFATGVNPAHSSIVGGSINHSTDKGIDANGLIFGQTFVGVQIFVSDISITDSDNIKFIGCDIRADNIIVTNSTNTTFKSCSFTITPSTFTGLSSCIFANTKWLLTPPAGFFDTNEQPLKVLGTITTLALGNPVIKMISTYVDTDNRNWEILSNLGNFGDFDIRHSPSMGTDPSVSAFKIKGTTGAVLIPNLAGTGTRIVTALADGTLAAGAPVSAIRTVTSNTTALTTDYTILSDATSGDVTINLPAAASCTGLLLSIKKINNTANNVILDPNGSEQIDFAPTYVITTYLQAIVIQSDGSAWYIIN